MAKDKNSVHRCVLGLKIGQNMDGKDDILLHNE